MIKNEKMFTVHLELIQGWFQNKETGVKNK